MHEHSFQRKKEFWKSVHKHRSYFGFFHFWQHQHPKWLGIHFLIPVAEKNSLCFARRWSPGAARRCSSFSKLSVPVNFHKFLQAFDYEVLKARRRRTRYPIKSLQSSQGLLKLAFSTWYMYIVHVPVKQTWGKNRAYELSVCLDGVQSISRKNIWGWQTLCT